MQGSQPSPLFLAVFLLLFLFAFVLVVTSMAWRIAKHRRKGIKFPRLGEDMVRYHEDFASGYSERHRYGFLKGGASRCLRVTVTEDEIWMRTFFPFTAFALDFDLEHRVPKSSVIALAEVPEAFNPAIELKFKDSAGDLHCIRLHLKQPSKFMQAVQSRPTTTPPTLPT